MHPLLSMLSITLAILLLRLLSFKFRSTIMKKQFRQIQLILAKVPNKLCRKLQPQKGILLLRKNKLRPKLSTIKIKSMKLKVKRHSLSTQSSITGAIVVQFQELTQIHRIQKTSKIRKKLKLKMINKIQQSHKHQLKFKKHKLVIMSKLRGMLNCLTVKLELINQ